MVVYPSPPCPASSVLGKVDRAMSRKSRCLAGILLVVFPTVVYGGASLLALLIGNPDYEANHLRQDLWRAGHAHAGVLLLLGLVMLRYADEARLSEPWRWVARRVIAFNSA
jgi:hypothetical protein